VTKDEAIKEVEKENIAELVKEFKEKVRMHLAKIDSYKQNLAIEETRLADLTFEKFSKEHKRNW
jgi:hypothetical protein